MNITTKEYFKTKAISHSLLSSLWNPRWIKFKIENPELENEDTKYFRIGSALDCLLTTPEDWESKFVVVDANRPYGYMGKFIDELPGGLTPESPTDMYQEAYDKAGYRMDISKVIDRMWSTDDIRSYYELTRDTADKTVISKDEFESVEKARELILANKYLIKYFKSQSNWHEIMRQVPVLFTYKGEQCKAFIDGILIDHDKKTIEPYDLKTTSKSVYDFPQSYLQYGYYRQCAFYELALRSEDSPVKQLLDEGYELLDFVFIVVESKVSSSHPAILYRTNAKDRECGMSGGRVGRKRYKGIDDLIEDYREHRSSDEWDMPMDLVRSSGEIQLDIFNAEEPIISTSESESDE